MPMTQSKSNFTVEHDKDKCALCVVCARNCPTQALRRDEDGNNLALYFNASKCDGCDGNALCEQNCPEKAIVSVGGDAGEDTFKLLSQSPMAQCEYCDEYFAPLRRLEVIATKTEKNDINTRFCPLCRRTSLVVDFIQKFRAQPGQVAEYRSARDITRRANKRMAAEEAAKRR